MVLVDVLATLEKQSITLKLKDGKISAPRGVLTNPLRRAILAHKPELIRHLQAEQVPVAAPAATERKIPGAIRLQYAIDWFTNASRKIPVADGGRQKARLTLPSRCRWLISWLSKAQQVELEEKGDLAWTDWNVIIGEVRGRFKTYLAA